MTTTTSIETYQHEFDGRTLEYVHETSRRDDGSYVCRVTRYQVRFPDGTVTKKYINKGNATKILVGGLK